MPAATGNMNTTDILLTLLRVAFGAEKRLPEPLSAEQWAAVLKEARKQSVVGIAFLGVSALPEDQYPEMAVIKSWLQLVYKITVTNESLSKGAVAVTDFFRSRGMRCVILKGQSLAPYYPHPEYRMSGDIDVWVDAPEAALAALARSLNPGCELCYHHADMSLPEAKKVEAHFRPSWMFNPVYNSRLQAFFRESAAGQFGNAVVTEHGAIAVPTTAFNRIYLLLHIYRHVFFEGVGLRQLVDYYYVLKAGFTEEEKAGTLAIIRRLGLLRICGAVMYVMKKAFGLEDGLLLTEPDRRRGEHLLSEILRGGNFGRYDDRVDRKAMAFAPRRWLERVRHDCRFALQYPSEALWAVPFRVWQKIWRIRLERRLR